MKEQNPEFQNLLRLLESNEPANVQLGLQLAQNYQSEFEAHYGYSLRNYSELVEFLWKHEVWDFTTSISKIRKLNLSNKQLKTLPDVLFSLTDLRVLNLSKNRLNILPQKIENFKRLKRLYLSGNQLSTLPQSLKYLTKCLIFVGYNPSNSLRECVKDKDWENILFYDG